MQSGAAAVIYRGLATHKNGQRAASQPDEQGLPCLEDPNVEGEAEFHSGIASLSGTTNLQRDREHIHGETQRN